MRLAVAVAALAAVLAGGCFGGGCFPDAHRLEWQDLAVTAAFASRAGDENVTWRQAMNGLPVGDEWLPVQGGNASLVSVTYSWPAETPEMDESTLSVRNAREGLTLAGRIDAHLGASAFGRRVDAFLAEVLADPADAPALRATLVDAYDPGRNDFAEHIRVAVPEAALGLDDLLAAHEPQWEASALGRWQADHGAWTFEASVAWWAFNASNGPQLDGLAADAAGWVQGPQVEVAGDVADEPAPQRSALEAAAASELARFGLGPPPADAKIRVAQRLCID